MIPGWPGYEASTLGRVRSVDRVLGDGRTAGGLLLAPQPDEDGYLYVTLSDGRRRKRVHVARLVLLAHAGKPGQPGMEALHRNGRNANNRLSNLRWGTREENRADRERHRRARLARRAKAHGVKQDETGAAAPCPEHVVSQPGKTSRSSP